MFANTDFAHSSANCWCSLVTSNKCLHDLIPVINIPESPPVCDPDFGFIIMPRTTMFSSPSMNVHRTACSSSVLI